MRQLKNAPADQTRKFTAHVESGRAQQLGFMRQRIPDCWTAEGSRAQCVNSDRYTVLIRRSARSNVLQFCARLVKGGRCDLDTTALACEERKKCPACCRAGISPGAEVIAYTSCCIGEREEH